MKRNIVGTFFFVAVLSLSLAAAAGENEKIDGYKCSASKVAGTWGYSETGEMTIALYGGTFPYSSVGSYTLDRYGKVSGYRIAGFGPYMNLKAWVVGTATVNPDCTGAVELSFYGDEELTLPAGWAEKFVVYVDNAQEARMIITSGSFDSANLVTNAKKLSPGHSNENGE